MDELENHPLSLLLLYHPDYFSQFLEWTKSVNLHHFILFLLEVDYAHFRSDDKFRLVQEKVNISQGQHFLSNAIRAITTSTHERYRDFMSHFPQLLQRSKAIHRLVESRIPCIDGFSDITQSVWQGLLRQGQMLTSQPNSIWPSLRRFLVENATIPLDNVLADSSKRRYFEKYLQTDPADLICLQCYINVQRILSDLNPYSVKSANPGASSTLNAAGIASSSAGGSKPEEKEKRIFNIKRWKASGKATINNVTLSKSVDSQDAHAMQNPKIYHQFVDPYECFKILLGGCRNIQRQYFPVTTQTTSSNVSINSNILSLNIVSRSRRSSSTTSMLSSNSAGSAPSQTSSASVTTCAGLSESLRMEITASLNMNKAVRLEDIEIIDASYAIANAHILDHHLHVLLEELYNYLVQKYKVFVETSNEYVSMLAYIDAIGIEAIQSYIHKADLVNTFVSEKAEMMHWADPRAKGVLYLKYHPEEDSIDTDEECKDAHHNHSAVPLSPSQRTHSTVSVTAEMNRREDERNLLRFDRPPTIIAARLDICKLLLKHVMLHICHTLLSFVCLILGVPEDNSLSKENAMYLPHSLRIFSNHLEEVEEDAAEEDGEIRNISSSSSSNSSDLEYNSDGSSVYSDDEIQTVVKKKLAKVDDVDAQQQFSIDTVGSVDYDALFKMPDSSQKKISLRHNKHQHVEDSREQLTTVRSFKDSLLHPVSDLKIDINVNKSTFEAPKEDAGKDFKHQRDYPRKPDSTIVLYEVQVDKELEEELTISQYGKMGIASSKHNLRAYNPLVSTMDILFQLLQITGVSMDSMDCTQSEDQVYMIVIDDRFVFRDVHSNLMSLFQFIYPVGDCHQQSYKIVLSLKVNPFLAGISLQEALHRIAQASHMHNQLTQAPPHQSFGTPAADPVRPSMKQQLVNKYIAGVQIVVSLVVEDMPGKHSHDSYKYASPIQLLREVIHQVKHFHSHHHHHHHGHSQHSQQLAQRRRRVYVRDNHRQAYKSLLEKMASGEQRHVHPSLWQEETLYDFYVGSHMPHMSKLQNIALSESDLHMLRTLPLTKLYGIYDTTLCAIFHIVNIRILIQILFLILTSSRSYIVLISSKPSLLMKLYGALPRLLHPFPFLHDMLFVQNMQLAYNVFHLKKRSALHNTTASISTSKCGNLGYNLGSPKGLKSTNASSSFSLGINNTLNSPPTISISTGSNPPSLLPPFSPNASSGSPTLSMQSPPSSPSQNSASPTHGIPRPGRLIIPDNATTMTSPIYSSQLARSLSEGDLDAGSPSRKTPTASASNPTVSSADNSVYEANGNTLYLLDARVYHLLKSELINQQAEPMNPSLLSSVVAFDLDSNTVVESFLTNSSTNSTGTGTGHTSQNQSSRQEVCPNSQITLDLADYKLYQCANFEALRQLISSIAIISTTFTKESSELHLCSSLHNAEEEEAYYVKLASITIRTNTEVEYSLKNFWQEILMQALPLHVYTLSECNVLLCDIQSILGKLLSNYMSNPYQTNEHGHSNLHQASSPYGAMTSPHSLPASALYDSILSMKFDEFLSFYNEHTASSGKSLIHAFYAEFLAGMSPVFLALLKKHSRLVKNWKF
ncbi:hypothetical protein EON65_06745 [archaeon]|nr:MAG: hypothetical protein EON65_06745 [archaeon]